MSRIGVRTLLLANLSQRRTDYTWTKSNVRLIWNFNVQWVLCRDGFVMHLLGCKSHGWYWYEGPDGEYYLFYYYKGSLPLRITQYPYCLSIKTDTYDELRIGSTIYFGITRRPWVLTASIDAQWDHKNKQLTARIDTVGVIFRYNGLAVEKRLVFGLSVGDTGYVIVQKIMNAVLREMEL